MVRKWLIAIMVIFITVTILHSDKYHSASAIASEDMSLMEIGALSFTGFTHSYDFSAEFFIELCLTDPLGRKVGYDPETNKYFRKIPYPRPYELPEFLAGEIPGSAYFNGVNPILQKGIQVKEPMSGNYRLQVIATQAGGYVMNIFLRDTNGGRWHSDELNSERIVSPGTVHTYKIYYDSEDINNLKAKKIVTFEELKTSLQVASSLHWINNTGTMNKLMTRLQNADAAFAKGQTRSLRTKLKGFINEVKAQRGKHIREEAADILINDTETFIKQWK